MATTSAGRSLGADHTFRTAGPRITSVTFSGSASAPTVTINGANLGTEPAGSAAGCGATGDTFGTSLFFTESTQAWTGGEAGDCIGLVVSSYSPTRIVYGFGSYYDTNGLGPANPGDHYTLSVLGKTFSGTIAYQ